MHASCTAAPRGAPRSNMTFPAVFATAFSMGKAPPCPHSCSAPLTNSRIHQKGGDQRSPANSCSLFDVITCTTRDSRRHQCGKPGRDPGRITTWLAGHRRRSQPPVASRNLPTSFITRRGARTYGKLVSKSGKHVFFASCSRGVCAPAHVAREIYLGKSCALSRNPGT